MKREEFQNRADGIRQSLPLEMQGIGGALLLLAEVANDLHFDLTCKEGGEGILVTVDHGKKDPIPVRITDFDDCLGVERVGY